MFVWIGGCNHYETVGMIHLLNNEGIVARGFGPGKRLCSGDTLILCFSSAPLLGWWRYLKLTQWVAGCYDIRVIVLCPEEVYQSGVVWGKNIDTVNGKSEIFQLSQVLLHTVQYCVQKEPEERCQRNVWSVFQEKVSQILLISPSSEADVSLARKAYSQRALMLQRLGFISLQILKVFMAGRIR